MLQHKPNTLRHNDINNKKVCQNDIFKGKIVIQKHNIISGITD